MTVKLYALSTCPYCNKTKKLLDEQGYVYESVDVDLAGEEEASRVLGEVDRLTGRRSFPVILIDNQVIQGYKPDAILNALHGVKNVNNDMNTDEKSERIPELSLCRRASSERESRRRTPRRNARQETGRSQVWMVIL